MCFEFPERVYLYIIAIYGLTTYYFLVFVNWISKFDFSFLSYFYITIIHILIFMLLWSMITTIIVRPGSSEVFWGFYMT